MEKEYELKYNIVGPEAGLSKEVRVLNRSVRWTPDGMQYECDRRHADICCGSLGHGRNEAFIVTWPHRNKSLTCFKKEEDKKEGNAEVGKRAVEHGSHSLFRALTARINYIAQDRADHLYPPATV